VRQTVTYSLAALKRVLSNCSASCVKSEVFFPSGSVNVTALGDLATCNVFNEGFDDECCGVLRNVDSYLRQINLHITSCVLSRRHRKMKYKMLQTGGKVK
jgi:hypothetical protein